ncbi:helix-turn-helix domain-containing protein [Azospirillum sp.]|uniref:helix-turn-helix domain-containing protein n=1 Tax=Azospirillum sp. TaxID=34012 RepID=UPI003D714CA7
MLSLRSQAPMMVGSGMERGDSGYFQVVAGMPDQQERLPNSAGRRMDDPARRALVERLRRQGWSYRRISTELNISYALVSRWLDGPEAAAPIEPLPIGVRTLRRPTAAAVPPTPQGARSPGESDPSHPLMEQLITQNRALLQRVDQLVAASAAQQQAIAGLEARLVANIEDQHKKLGERLLDSIKLLLSKIIPG